MDKICSKCKILKPFTNFSKGSGTYNLQNYCKECSFEYGKTPNMKTYQIRYRQSPKGKEFIKHPNAIYATLKYNATRDNKLLTFTLKDFTVWYVNQPKRCVYCNREESEAIKDRDGKYNRLSIDRMNNNLGYDLDNIALACCRCNVRKSDDLTFNQMKEVANFINKLKEK